MVDKTINVIKYTNEMKEENHMIISIDTEKNAFNRVRHPFMIKLSMK